MDQDPAPDQTPAPAPAATPAQEVGAGLKATRISRGYSLESVSQHTRIPRRFLEALESGRFEDLPAPVYLRSFLAGYCEYLELELQPLWAKLHPAPSAAVAAGDAAAKAPAPAKPAPAAPAAPAPSAGPQAPAGRSPLRPATPLEASPYFNALVSASGAVLLSLMLALALVWWAARGHAGPASEGSLRASGQALPDWQSLSRPSRPVLEPKLVLACRQDSWVGVKADGVVLFAGRLPRNARQEFAAHKTILLRASDPEDLILTLNGAPYRLPRPDDNGDYRIESL
jgi:hypothetical protein